MTSEDTHNKTKIFLEKIQNQIFLDKQNKLPAIIDNDCYWLYKKINFYF